MKPPANLLGSCTAPTTTTTRRPAIDPLGDTWNRDAGHELVLDPGAPRAGDAV